jgi:hypothetical protein
MSNSFDDDDVALNPELHAEISGPQAISAGKISPQRFSTAYIRPFLQSFQETVHPRPNRLGELRKLFSGSGGKSNHCSIVNYGDI